MNPGQVQRKQGSNIRYPDLQQGHSMRKKNNVECWDEEAKKLSRPSYWFSYYIGNSYIRATKMGLMHSTKNKICMLKTDLWNEGIDRSRDILGLYKNQENFDLYGIDISPFVCSSARSKGNYVHVICGDIMTMPFKKDSFDMILDLSTLDHIHEDRIADVLREYKLVLNNNGILILIYWYNGILHKHIRILSKLIKRRMISKRPENSILLQYYFSLNKTKKLIGDEFDIIDEYCIGTLLCIPYLGCIFDKLPIFILNAFLDIVSGLEYSRISKDVFKNIGGLHVVIGRKR